MQKKPVANSLSRAESRAIAHQQPCKHCGGVLQKKVDESAVQLHAGSQQNAITPSAKNNNTGLPDNLRSGLENLSGYDLSHVRVHFNSSKPAHLNAHAYAQGNQIHLGPGQEKHLPHEGWHVVQQMQGRVKPTRQLKSRVQINDDKSLENEADVMGAKAMQVVTIEGKPLLQKRALQDGPIQGDVGFELEVNIPVSQEVLPHDATAAHLRPAANDWANARTPFPEADPHGHPPVPQTVIYAANNGGQGVDAVPDKRRLAAGAPRQILEIRVDPIDTANIAGLAATMNNVRAGIDPLYNGINLGDPVNNRFPIPGGQPCMVGLPAQPDPTHAFNEGNRASVSWQTYMQATAGIRSSRLRNLSRAIQRGANGGDPSLNSLQSPVNRHRNIARDARAAALNVYNNVHGVQPNPDDGLGGEKEAALGFLTLICMYMIGGSSNYQGQGNLNPKNMAPLFSRSGFNQIRNQTLSINVQNWITTYDHLFRTQIVSQTRAAQGDGVMSYLFNRQHMAQPTERVMIFLNDALANNMDRYTNREAKSIIPPENVGGPRPGAVLEFRNIGNAGNTPANWVAKMTEVITAIHHVNT
ncbi:MAG: DUF4157 domain-containing protein [Chitinophagaceae bacterium]